jgi:hypothetical protein
MRYIAAMDLEKGDRFVTGSRVRFDVEDIEENEDGHRRVVGYCRAYRTRSEFFFHPSDSIELVTE